MAGHSKWSTIKHKKAKTDAQRGKLFSKLAREIMVAARLGGGDPEMNPRLRLAIQKGREANMPGDNVKRAIQKGTGEMDGVQYEEITFEAYGPHGVGLLIDVLTDNKNRTLPNIKIILNKNNGSFASKGAVSYQFKQKGLFLFDNGSPEDTIMDIALEAGADDIDVKSDGSIEITTPPELFESVHRVFSEKNLPIASATVAMIPQTAVQLETEKCQDILKLIDALEEDDDVQSVSATLEMTEDQLQSLSS